MTPDPIIIPVTPAQTVTTPAQPQPIVLSADNLDGIIALLNASGVSVSGGLSIGSANLETLTIQRRDDGSGTPNFLVNIALGN